MRRTRLLSALVLAAAGALAACDPYGYPGYPGDPGYYPPPPPPPPPPGYPPHPGPGYPGQFVETVGCVRPGVEASCLILQGADGHAWNVTGLQPPPNPQWAVRATGRVAADMGSFCQQGAVLSEVRYEYTGLRCVAAQVQGYRPY